MRKSKSILKRRKTLRMRGTSIRSPQTIRGRTFTTYEINLISKLAQEYFEEGRTRISIEVCKALNWRQPNGWLKDRACREVLRFLHRNRYLRLPKSKAVRKRGNNRLRLQRTFLQNVDTTLITSADLYSLVFKQVKGDKDKLLWNWLVNKYHYLGFKVFVGRSLKYLVYSGDRILAAIGLCDPAWSLAARDVPLKKLGIEVEEIRRRGINNGRFLIMPWVKVENLASRILSITIRRFVKDWQSYYSVNPLMLETFVEPGRFNGTCYKAANWVYLGRSRGYLKSGSSHWNSQVPKMLFVYPLARNIKKKLKEYLRERKDAVPDG